MPVLEFAGHRATLTEWSDRRGREKVIEYQREKNAASIDGLPAITPPATTP